MNCPHPICYLGPVPPAASSAPFYKQRKLAWEQYRRRTHMLPVAFGYALRGMSVLPCRARGKEPLTEHGFKDATTNTDVIRGMWKHWPDANVAIRTGSVSNLLVVDVDPRNGGSESLAELEENHGSLPTDYVVETSDGGRHHYFRLPDGVVIPSSVLADGIDIKCENGYVIAPPSVHPSGHVYAFAGRGTVPNDAPPPPLAPDWLIAKRSQKAAAQAHTQSEAPVSVDDLHVSDEIKRLIREGKPQGQRSQAIFGVLRAMCNAGHSDDDMISVMMNPSHGISEKPRTNGLTWLRGEMERARTKPDRDAGRASQGDDTASSTANESGGPSGAKTNGSASGATRATGSSENAKGSTARFKLLSIDDLKRMPPPTWLLSNLLVAGSLAVLYGPPGVGKSFLALDFALSISTGCEGVAEPNGCGPVVYVAAEGFGGLIHRVAAWEQAHSRDAADIYFLPEVVNLSDKADTDELIASVRALPTPPLLIVIDTMARCLSGDENSAKDVGQFVTMVDAIRSAFKCAVLVVHHGTKSKAQTERGSSALRGAADTMFFLERCFSMLTLSCEKQKDAAEFEQIPLHLENIDLEGEQSSCVMRSDDGGATDPGTSPGEHGKVILEFLKAKGECTYTELRVKFMDETNLSKRTFGRALKTLVQTGSIKKTDSLKYVLS